MAASFDDTILEIAVKRKPVLAKLAEEPQHRQELQDELELSKTTCHRIIRTFDDNGLLRRTDQGYALTTLGQIIHQQVDQFDSAVRTAYELQPLIDAFADADIAFDIELFESVSVSTPEPGNPYPYVERQLELLCNSDTMRILDCGQLIPPTFLDEAIELCLETGLRAEFVVSPEIAIRNMEEYPDLQREVAQSETVTGQYFVHDDIQFGMGIYDGHLDFRVYNPETGTPLIYAETDSEEAIEWAKTVYADYRNTAEPATSLDAYPEWAPNTPFEADP